MRPDRLYHHLETTRADVNAAAAAQEAGEDRRITLGRTAVKIGEERLGTLRAGIETLLLAARDDPDEDGVWTTVLWVAIDRQDRRTAPPSPSKASNHSSTTSAASAARF